MAKTLADGRGHMDGADGSQILRSNTLGGKTNRKKTKKMKKQQLLDLLSSVQTGDQTNLELGIEQEVNQEGGDVLAMMDTPSPRPSRKGSWQVNYITLHTLPTQTHLTNTNTPYQHTLPTHLIHIRSQYILSRHLLNTPYQRALSRTLSHPPTFPFTPFSPPPSHPPPPSPLPTSR